MQESIVVFGLELGRIGLRQFLPMLSQCLTRLGHEIEARHELRVDELGELEAEKALASYLTNEIRFWWIPARNGRQNDRHLDDRGELAKHLQFNVRLISHGHNGAF